MIWRSYHPTHGSTGNGAHDEALHDRRTAIDELGAALRELVERATVTEVDAETIRRVADDVRRVTGPLADRPRGRTQLPTADDLLGGIRMYNPVSGTGSALAPPVRAEIVDGVVVGACTLGLAYEGPPMYAHGGISALLLDHMLGYATTASGHPGMTVRLDTVYRAPVPLQTPLHLTGRVTDVNGRKVTAHGIIATAADPDAILVEATGTFVAVPPEKAKALFGTMRR
ncbi:PaaI family thioesterase [Virgisporangium ochraceum]|uniref:Acyl-coenzyme A thioesterase THEM4 n=1 Tax=Virgisporangium ochraceum TaxID=65505 RepID=A0A8J3ZY54_9ACTN|nr:PaaI family thioesterase [Virgisporangium ochraceum]GIJ71032.1 thioesterase [Virgisporangium ochraceum]